MPASLPQRPSLVGKRNGLAMLERRREREADIRPAVVVSALGREFLTVKDSANDTTYVVANPTGKTYAPDSVVYLGSNTGHGPEFVLAGPPTGFGGSSVSPSIGYRTPLPSEPVTAPTHLAYFLGSILATYYVGTVAGDTIGSATEAAESLDSMVFVRSDSREYVNDLCLAYTVQASNRVSLFDPTAETVYSYTPPDAYHISGVHYASGYLWWCEGEDVEHGGVGTYATYFRLRRANCDLTDVTTIGSFEFDNDTGDETGFSMGWDQGFSAHVQRAAGLIVEAPWSDKVNGDINGTIRITWAYAGTQTHESEQSWVDPLPSSDVTLEEPVAVTDHPTYGTPLLGGAYPLTV